MSPKRKAKPAALPTDAPTPPVPEAPTPPTAAAPELPPKPAVTITAFAAKPAAGLTFRAQITGDIDLRACMAEFRLVDSTLNTASDAICTIDGNELTCSLPRPVAGIYFGRFLLHSTAGQMASELFRYTVVAP